MDTNISHIIGGNCCCSIQMCQATWLVLSACDDYQLGVLCQGKSTCHGFFKFFYSRWLKHSPFPSGAGSLDCDPTWWNPALSLSPLLIRIELKCKPGYARCYEETINEHYSAATKLSTVRGLQVFRHMQADEGFGVPYTF